MEGFEILFGGTVLFSGCDCVHVDDEYIWKWQLRNPHMENEERHMGLHDVNVVGSDF